MARKSLFKQSLRNNLATNADFENRVSSVQERKMKRLLSLLVFVLFCGTAVSLAQERFTLEQITSAPFPSDLVASKTGSRIAWILNEQGKRNIWVAEGPNFNPRRLTSYLEDDGQELSSLSFSP